MSISELFPKHNELWIHKKGNDFYDNTRSVFAQILVFLTLMTNY